MDATRRDFIQWAGAGIASAVLTAQDAAASTQAPAGPPPARDAADAEAARSAGAPSLAELVNVMQGTASTYNFSRGNTLPIVALPFGMAHWSLQTRDEGPWFFSPGDQRLNGIRCTHQLSPWLSDYGYASFLPFTGDARPQPEARSSSYRPSEVKIHPHSLTIELLRYRTLLELAPTERCASMRVAFNDARPGLFVDLPGSDAEIRQQDGKLYATVRANAGGVAPGFGTYYVIESDLPLKDFKIEELRNGRVAIVRFAAENSKAVLQLHIGTSFISFEQAALNLRREIGSRPFDSTRQAAADIWNEHLGRALVEGGTAEQRRIYYSAMYRALLFPRIWHEHDSAGEPVHWSPYSGKLAKGVLYADHGYWDVYRAWYPWMSLLFPERLGEILQAWVNAANEGGWLPQFPAPGYRACMTGSLIDSVFGDAAAKGIKGFDVETAFAMLKKHATQPGDPDKGYGRRGIEDYLTLGYVSVEGAAQSVAETVDAAYGDFCISRVAQALGRTEDAKYFEKRSAGWRHLYDERTQFLRGKHRDGRWLEDFDPIRWGDPYVEGSAWQHRWDVPHEPEALMRAMGGPENFAAQLESMIAQPPYFRVGSYRAEIHEMAEMAAVRFGQYAHSNQPVHHVLYLFAIAGRPDRLQYWARRVLTELYTVDAFPGDEDTGSMSAWFLLSSMGFYPLCPGKPEYVIGAPLFDRVTLKLSNGATSVIEAEANDASNCFVRACTLNGRPVDGIYLAHADAMKGMQLKFEMAAVPSA